MAPIPNQGSNRKGRRRGKGRRRVSGDERVDNTVVPPSYEDPAPETFREESMSSKREILGDESVDNTSPRDNRPPFTKHAAGEIGYIVDIGDLLFTAERDYLVKNNREKVRVTALKGKTIVLFMFPLDPAHLWGIDHPDMIDAYNQMLGKGPDVEFVLVPVAPYPDRPVQFPMPSFDSPEDLFNYLLSTIPFPAVPFSDVAACGDRVLQTFSPDALPYWVVIDPNHQVVSTRHLRGHLFKLFGRDELYPLTPQAIDACRLPESRKEYISKWDQLLESPGRDFLLSSNGDKVSVASLKGKVIGLYFCENVPNPPRMELIKKVYQEAKKLSHAFEIVQIDFHYHFFRSGNLGHNPTVMPRRENVSWLTLPFKDPSCRKLQRVFNCADDDDWYEDRLVIVDTRHADVQFEFSGAEMLQAYGVEAYPFNRYSLYRTEYRRQKREVKLHSLFPPGAPLLGRSGTVDVSHLLGKRVLVLFAGQSICNPGGEYISMLKSKYDDESVAEEDKFEVVYVSTDQYMSESSFAKCREFMPWLVHPYSVDFACDCALKVFKAFNLLMVSAVAFEKDGELIAKELYLSLKKKKWGEKKFQFPFIPQPEDLKETVRGEVQVLCDLYRYCCGYESDDESLISWE